MIVVIGTATAASGQCDELLAASKAHVARSLQEPGCLSHEVTQGADDPNRLVFVERWEDMAALQAHFEVPASRDFGAAILRLTDGAFSLELFEASPLELG